MKIILNELESPIVTIGIPTFNSEKFLRKAIESVLNQTFRNFVLIISDNVSTDSTSKICMEYTQKDSRVKYIQQTKNLFMMGNFRFLADYSKTKYFVWLESDDYWEPTFLEKNTKILESNHNLVGSISEVNFYGKYANRYKTNGRFGKYSVVKPFSGDYHKKIQLLLKSQGSMIFGIYRTKDFQKSLPRNKNWLHEYELLLPLLKHGDFHVIDEVLMYRNADGMSSSSQIHSMRSSFGLSRLEIIFMNWPIIRLSLKNLGLKFMLKNFRLYLKLMYVSYGRIVLDFLRVCSKLT